MRWAIHAAVLAGAVALTPAAASAQSWCAGIKKLMQTDDLQTLATGQQKQLSDSAADVIQSRAPGKVILPNTSDCKVHQTDYKNKLQQDLSYYCEITDVDAKSTDHKRIMRTLEQRMRPCMTGWAESEDFSESNDPKMSFLNTYSVDYRKGGRKISIIRLISLDDQSTYSTTFNVIDAFGK